MSRFSVRIARKTTEAPGICSLELVAEGRADLEPFTAGAHIDVHLPNGLVRQYSLCNSQEEQHRYQIAVLLDPGSRGGSAAVHALQEGGLLEIGAPRNHFALDEAAGHSILVAGGIGITPILCMADRLSRLGASFELHYCTRSRDRAAFLRRLRRSSFADRVHLHFDDEDPAQRLDSEKLLAQRDTETHLYVCGPGGFMNGLLAAAGDGGWPSANVHREFFAAQAQDHSADGSFEVEIASTGRRVHVGAHVTVVQALAAAGISVETSCEQGVCGTCLTRVIRGEPDHRDMYLTDDERARNDCFLPCCSRAGSSSLVLDL